MSLTRFFPSRLWVPFTLTALALLASACLGSPPPAPPTPTAPPPSATPTQPSPTPTPTQAIPTATPEPVLIPPPIATLSNADREAAGISYTRFETLRLLFEDWWLFWTEIEAVSIAAMPPVVQETGAEVSAVYRIFIDPGTNKKMIGVEIMAGDYAGQILTFPLGRENGDASGRPEAEAIVDDPAARADWYPLFLSGENVGHCAGYWVRFDQHGDVFAYLEPTNKTWVEVQVPTLADSYWKNIGTIPETMETIWTLPLIPNPIENSQEEYERWMTEYLRRARERVNWNDPGIWWHSGIRNGGANYGGSYGCADGTNVIELLEGATRVPVATARINYQGRDGLVITFAVKSAGEVPQQLLWSFVVDPLESLIELSPQLSIEYVLTQLNEGNWRLLVYFVNSNTNYEQHVGTDAIFRNELLRVYTKLGYDMNVIGTILAGLESDMEIILWPLLGLSSG